MIIKADDDIQNLAEAEYAIALFMWLRLNQHEFNEMEHSIKLSDKRITIVTSEKGQKELIKGMIEKKCSWHPLIGSPHRVITQEEYLGGEVAHQEDIVILSLVYTDVGMITNHVAFTSDYHSWLKERCDYVLCRKDVFEDLASQPAINWSLQREGSSESVKDFRNLYRVV